MIELLITASIVAVSLLAIAAIFPVALSNIDTGAEQTAATAVGQAYTEMIRNIPWDTLLAYNNFDSRDATTCPQAPAHPAQANADCLRWIDQIRGNPAANPPAEGLPNGQAGVRVATMPGLNPDNVGQLLATVTVTITWSPRQQAWLPLSPRRNLVFVTRRSQ
jgi:hypothetical protein